MAKFSEGDVVQVVSREATPADAKNQTYYPYFVGLTGTVDKVYDGEVCVKVDPEVLPADVLKRHTEIQESIKRKWLNGLSGEARNRLTPEEKQFKLSYTILIQANDLEKIKPGPKPAPKKHTPAPEPVKAEKTPAASKTPKPEKPAEATRKATSPKPAKEENTNGLTEAELAFLREREEKLKKEKA